MEIQRTYGKMDYIFFSEEAAEAAENIWESNFSALHLAAQTPTHKLQVLREFESSMETDGGLEFYFL